MPLSSTYPKHAQFFTQPCVVMDCSALSDVLKRADVDQLMSALLARFSLVVPTPVIYELAFGAPTQAHQNEIRFRKLLLDHRFQLSQEDYIARSRCSDIGPGKLIALNPSYNDWWTARDRLLLHVEATGQKPGDAKRKLSFDAIIHSCARNIFAPICTADVSDFRKLNEAAERRKFDGCVPTFTLDELTRSEAEEIAFVL